MRYLAIAITSILLACAGFAAQTAAKYTPPSAEEIAAAQKQNRYLVTITMADEKKIEIVLEGKEAPLTVANFVKLINAKFYDGLTFHRVENQERQVGMVQGRFVSNPPFKLIQGGDPNGDGSGGPGYQIKREISPNLKHKRGAIAMAREPQPDTAGCQFYITKHDTPQLDGNYAVFGWVKSGLEVVDAIKVGARMKTVTVAPYAGKEPCPISAGRPAEKP